jgi:hypothetical protein
MKDMAAPYSVMTAEFIKALGNPDFRSYLLAPDSFRPDSYWIDPAQAGSIQRTQNPEFNSQK